MKERGKAAHEDGWVELFGKRIAPRFIKVFTPPDEDLPATLVEKLQRLKRAEDAHRTKDETNLGDDRAQPTKGFVGK